MDDPRLLTSSAKPTSLPPCRKGIVAQSLTAQRRRRNHQSRSRTLAACVCSSVVNCNGTGVHSESPVVWSKSRKDESSAQARVVVSCLRSHCRRGRVVFPTHMQGIYTCTIA